MKKFQEYLEMTKNQASTKGYYDTHRYTLNRSEAEEKVAKLKSQGYKAIVVDVPHSKYSRGGPGKGYSVFADKKWYDDEIVKGHGQQKEYMKREIENLEKEIVEKQKKIEKLKAKLGG